MITKRLPSAIRLLVAAGALGATAVGVATALPVDAAGLRNCVDVRLEGRSRRLLRAGLGRQRPASDDVLEPGVEVRRSSSTPSTCSRPRQTSAGRSAEHVPARPRRPERARRNRGNYSVKLQGFLVPVQRPGHHQRRMRPVVHVVGGPDPLPFATTVNGHALTSSDAIESAAGSGLVALVNLGPNAVMAIQQHQRPLTSRARPDCVSTRGPTPW